MFNEDFNKSEFSMLKRKKTTLLNKLEKLKEEIKTINKDIVALDQTIKLFTNEKDDKTTKEYDFAKGELQKLIIKEDRLEVNGFTHKLLILKNKDEKDFKKIKASVVATLHKLVSKGKIQKLDNGLYISKYSDHHCS